jgi:hypothetical protein
VVMSGTVGVLVGGDVMTGGDWSVQRWVFEWQDYDRFSTVRVDPPKVLTTK